MDRSKYRVTVKTVLAILFLAVCLLLTLPQMVAAQESCVVPSNSALKPQGVNVGQSFRLVFITSSSRNAQSDKIADYNTFIKQDAKAGHPAIRACSDQFKALASTSAVDARDNISLGVSGGVPVYWLNGPKIADDYADFWDGAWDNSSNGRKADGTVIGRNDAGRIWTGTRAGNGALDIDAAPEAERGEKQSSGHLGTTTLMDSIQQAMTGQLSSNPIVTGTPGFMPLTDLYRMYGISPLFTVGKIVRLKRTSSGMIYENDGVIKFTVSLERPLAGGERVDVPLVLSGGDITADDFDDLAKVSGAGLNRGVTLEGAGGTTPTVIFEGAGAQLATLQWVVTDDNKIEDDETATISLGDLTSAPDTTVPLTADENHNAFGVEIKDDEYTFCFEKITYRIDEDVGGAVLELNLSRPLTEDIEVRFQYILLSDDGDEPKIMGSRTDFEPQYVYPNYATIPAGSTQFILSIPVIDDTRVEDSELARIVAIPPELPIGHIRCTTDFIIVDNDEEGKDPTVTIRLGNQFGSENEPTIGKPIKFSVWRSVADSTILKFSLNVSESGGGNLVPDDKEGQRDQYIGQNIRVYSHQVPTNKSNNSGKITIKLLPSSKDPPDYFLGTPSSISVVNGDSLVIEEDGIKKDAESAVVSLEYTGVASIYESGTIEFTVSLSRPLLAGERVDVPLIISGDSIVARYLGSLSSSTAGVQVHDHDRTNPTVIFEGAGARVATLKWIPDDDRLEADGTDATATINFGDLSSDPDTNIPLTADGKKNAFGVEIKDNEYTVCFEKKEYTVDESVGEAELWLEINGIDEDSNSVPRSLTEDLPQRFAYAYDGCDETAVGSSDTDPPNPNKWDFLTRNVYPAYTTIKAGTTRFPLSIPVVDDRRVEGDELACIVAIPPALPQGEIRCGTKLIIKDNDPIVTIGRDGTPSSDDGMPFIVHGSDPRTSQLTVYKQIGNIESSSAFSPEIITLRPEPLATTLTVSYNVSQSGDGDFVSAENDGTNTLVIPSGAITMRGSVPIINVNGGNSNSGEIVVRLVQPQQKSPNYFLGAPASASVIIREGMLLSNVRIRSKVFLEGPLQ